MSEPHITRLENGLTIITVPNGTKQPYINLRVGAGSRNETDAEAGISHFLEHMLASDTEFHSDQERALMVQKMRGTGNAQTEFEETSYYYRVNEAHVEAAMKLIADGIQHPLMSEAKIEKERGAILAEMRAAFSAPDEIHDLMMMSTAYAGSNLERDVGGNLKNIAGFSKQDLQNYMKKHYTSDNMVLTVVGNVDHAEICKQASEIFDSLPRSADPQAHKQPAPAPYRGGYAVKDAPESDEISFALTFPTDGVENLESKAKNMLLSNIIAGDFNSKLMVALRGDSGLVYSVYAQTRNFLETGLFIIQSGLESDNAREAVTIMCEELKNAANTITQEELDGVRDMLAGQVERAMEYVESQGDRASKQWLLQGEITPIEALLEAIDKVTLEDIQAHAAKTFSGVPTVAAMGNGVSAIPTFEEITGLLGKARSVDASGLALESAPSADRSVKNAEMTASPAIAKQRNVA